MPRQTVKKYDYIREDECQSADNKSQSRCFCITILNYTYADIVRLRRLEHTYKPKFITKENNYVIKYICFWTDKTENGVPYIQGFVRFTNRIITSIVSIIYGNCRVIKTRGVPDKQDTYNNFEEYGVKNKKINVDSIVLKNRHSI